MKKPIPVDVRNGFWLFLAVFCGCLPRDEFSDPRPTPEGECATTNVGWSGSAEA